MLPFIRLIRWMPWTGLDFPGGSLGSSLNHGPIRQSIGLLETRRIEENGLTRVSGHGGKVIYLLIKSTYNLVLSNPFLVDIQIILGNCLAGLVYSLSP